MEQKRMDTEAYRDLLIYGFGTSRTGPSFSGLHGDLLTELFNKETIGNAGPFRSGYSTKVKSVNTWVRTSHIHCEIRFELKEKMKLSTSTTHKEMSSSNMKRHNYHVKSLKIYNEDISDRSFFQWTSRFNRDW